MENNFTFLYDDITSTWNYTESYSDIEIPEYTIGIWDILFCILIVLILLSNGWVFFMVICTKLRNDIFYWKLMVCTFGDLLLCIFLPFGTIFNYLDGWKTTTSCQAILYFFMMYGIYIKLALASLCVDPIIKHIFFQYKPRQSITRGVNAMCLLLPFIVTVLIILPIVIQFIGVDVYRYSHGNGSRSVCIQHQHNNNDQQINLAILILDAVIVIPALCILIVFACMKRIRGRIVRNQNDYVTLKGIDNVNQDPKAAGKQDENLIMGIKAEEYQDETNHDDSNITVIIVGTVLTELLSIPAITLYILPDLWINSGWAETTFSISRMLYYIPALVRPYIWLFGTDMREHLKNAVNTCCHRNNKM